MNERSLRVLEFNKIKENLRKYAVTSGGKELVDNLAPYSSAYEVREALEESREALELLIKKGNPPFEGLHDVREGIERAKKGGCLNPAQLLYIGNMLRCTSRIQEYLTRKEEEESFPKLEDLAYILTPIKNLENEIENAIVSEEEISDRASSTLHNIRRSLKEKNSSVRDKINSIVRSNAKYLQDAIYTMRGDRYVLPVKAEYKGAVPGLVHDQSSTGATLFIEPMSLVNLNNEIKELKLKEQAEIERILWALSKKVKDNSDVCSSNMKILLQIDFIFAKGKYASSIDGMMPKVNEDGSFNLVGAKHPLIDRDKVVPSDIYLGKNFSVLMVTGPNTGGKTVTIKTVGLLHLMGMSGLLIPTRDDSSISFYREVFADIGDEQSIEQSLSTFSSHLTNIVGIMREADRDSLVLFDELGAGTDPTEGAALATAIIETLKERGTKIIGTTHYSELKGYALKTPGVENASVEFDVETLRPTYRLLIGVPGKSNAFEISRRLGLDDFVIEKAKGFVSEENMQFEDLIRDLQEKSIIANRDAREAERIKIETEKIKRTYEEKLKRLETTRDKAYNEARREAKEIISAAKDEADEILKAMRELEKLGISGGGRKRLEEERKKLKDSLEDREKALIKERENAGEVIEKVTLGMEAFLPSLNQKVIIISMPDNRGEVQVEAGIMKISVKLKDLRKAEKTKEEKVRKKREVKLNLRSVESRLDLRGLDAEEACYRTDKYLDEAYMANLGEVTIVHGKGTGILRKAINDMLKRHPHVKSYRLGAYGEGGDGVTMVELK
ncbi:MULTISPECIES: endonuclease MutS2 [Clostridium]|uniref:endonuclease MutS2 n=1 Tax=Clostridium TaxID=1485 RepID=UPI0006686EEA|nr:MULTISPECIES: endonuclease MutS2 [Clostridium]MDB2087498.1 endonuclease MutS2 [Clostridium paraputrificum]MDB2098012.1 endonuclease MutS2 [Clostridium paraputrificum]MDB2106075.1 endonuclease MutS2 [Clostridium paraputrificum]MDB2114127.1 endonuclease MutS2 [Clostridium paraputrificum]MDB2117648.1 endonuclease MutS2 [Clostridium paraputrificum]